MVAEPGDAGAGRGERWSGRRVGVLELVLDRVLGAGAVDRVDGGVDDPPGPGGAGEVEREVLIAGEQRAVAGPVGVADGDGDGSGVVAAGDVVSGDVAQVVVVQARAEAEDRDGQQGVAAAG